MKSSFPLFLTPLLVTSFAPNASRASGPPSVGVFGALRVGRSRGGAEWLRGPHARTTAERRGSAGRQDTEPGTVGARHRAVKATRSHRCHRGSSGAQWRPEEEVQETWDPTDPRVLYPGLTLPRPDRLRARRARQRRAFPAAERRACGPIPAPTPWLSGRPGARCCAKAEVATMIGTRADPPRSWRFKGSSRQ